MTQTNTGNPPRQAVVLIHGIGEQRPMDTLRSFVAAFLSTGTYHSKPDTLSDSYELRRLKLRKCVSDDPSKSCNTDWPETDFYEYYWAHQMYGTTVSHITSWLWSLMVHGLAAIRSTRPEYHPRLKWLVPLAWIVALTVIAVMVGVAVHTCMGMTMKLGLAGAFVMALWGLARAPLLGVFTDFAGDAARYFDVNPKNITRRYDILRGGIAMLRKLHDDRDETNTKVMHRYGRVVLVGHSLGSVIAYDILRHYWHEVNGQIPVDALDFTEVESFEGGNGHASFPGATPYTDTDRFRSAQRKAWQALNRRSPAGVRISKKNTASKPGRRWIVTDLVTLGSPLTYAPLMLADNAEGLDEKKRLRELPTCPPDRSRNLNPGRFTVKLSAEAERFQDYDILPQGAYFALTRWTNLYFNNDPVGGPLGSAFGRGVEDVGLDGSGFSPIAAHLGYWSSSKPGTKPARARLEAILKRRVT